MTRRDLTITGLVVGGLLVLAFVVEHFRDAHRDAELVQLHQKISADSTVRVAAVARTDSLGARVDTAARAVARVDTVWRAVSSVSAARVRAIVASVVPETVKVRELVQIVDTLRIVGDSLARRAVALVSADSVFRAQAVVERGSWATERKDLAHALDVSERRHRHFGLGVTLGYAALRTPDGSVRAGPGITVGLAYRW